MTESDQNSLGDREDFLVRGEVASILSSTQLVLNRGSRDGVEVGDYFGIYGAGVKITDPENPARTLGTVFRPKVKVQVTQVADTLSVAETFEMLKVNVGGSLFHSLDASAFAPPKIVERQVTFKAEDLDIPEDLDPKDSLVKPGDVAKQIESPSVDLMLWTES